MQFSGSIVASITPFNQGKIHEEALYDLADFHAQAGTSAIVACGTTGEGALLTFEEWKTVVSTYVKASAGRFPVIAGCGSASTAQSLELVKKAKQLGACAALVVTPYYVKPSQAGVYAHFKTLSTEANLPLIAYDNPARVVCSLSVETIMGLSQLPNVVALKESREDVSRLLELRRRIKKPFSFLAGDDPIAAAYLAYGGNGIISTSANAAPGLTRDLCTAWATQDMALFAQRRDQLGELNQALSGETNPIPIKYAVSQLGLCKDEIRLPLLPASLETKENIKRVLNSLKLSVFSQPGLKEAG